jgi:hypothetical protein
MRESFEQGRRKVSELCYIFKTECINLIRKIFLSNVASKEAYTAVMSFHKLESSRALCLRSLGHILFVGVGYDAKFSSPCGLFLEVVPVSDLITQHFHKKFNTLFCLMH